MLSRCLRRDETAVFPGFCAVSGFEKGRDCRFPASRVRNRRFYPRPLSFPSFPPSVVCGLGAGDGTRLLFFLGFMRSRCSRWDETVAAVSSASRVWLAARLPCAFLQRRGCGTAVVFEALGVAEWRLALQDGTVAVICLHFTVEKPTASAESRGTYDGLPFRAYFAADLWETKR